jgi:hypothetical protein
VAQIARTRLSNANQRAAASGHAAVQMRREVPRLLPVYSVVIPLSTSSGTGGFGERWGGRCPPQQQTFCAAAYRLPTAHAGFEALTPKNHPALFDRLRVKVGAESQGLRTSSLPATHSFGSHES